MVCHICPFFVVLLIEKDVLLDVLWAFVRSVLCCDALEAKNGYRRIARKSEHALGRISDPTYLFTGETQDQVVALRSYREGISVDALLGVCTLSDARKSDWISARGSVPSRVLRFTVLVV